MLLPWLTCSIADFIQRRTKVVLVIILFGASAAFTWFLLICLKVLPASTGRLFSICHTVGWFHWRLSLVCLYISATLGGLFVNGTIPLFYELAVESTYPVAEGTTAGILTLMNNLGCLIFLLMPMFSKLKNTMHDWMNPTMAASCFVCIPVMLLFKARYRRLSIDLPSSEKKFG